MQSDRKQKSWIKPWFLTTTHLTIDTQQQNMLKARKIFNLKPDPEVIVATEKVIWKSSLYRWND